MLNIIKRIFLRIKILKRFSFFYISNVYLDKKNNKVYTMAIQNKKEQIFMEVLRVQKWGNSQGIRLPKKIIEERNKDK